LIKSFGAEEKDAQGYGLSTNADTTIGRKTRTQARSVGSQTYRHNIRH